jgi:lipopolysaccharide biosynthesis glycosyltransferase
MHKIACVGIISKEYLPGATVFFKSLLKYNSNFNLPFIIFKLDNCNYSDLKKIYKHIIFKKMPNKKYGIFLSKNSRKWKYSPFNRLEIFNLNYDRILYFDFDILINSNIDYILNNTSNFTAFKINNENYFSAGVLSIRKKFLNKKTYLKIIKKYKNTEWTGNEPLLNDFFKNKVEFFKDNYHSLTIQQIKTPHSLALLHFVGDKKPWHHGKLTEKYDAYIFTKNKIETIFTMQQMFNKFLL